MKRYHVPLTLLFVVFVLLTEAQQIQFRGPNRDGKFPETGLLKSWPEAGPELLLKAEGIGKGFSSVVANEQFIYATGMIDSLDYLSCLTSDGTLKWRVPYGRSWTKSFPDTRSTPTIDGDRIYVVSGIGELACINQADGSIRWKVNVDKDFGAVWYRWGVSESPLVVDDMVICSPSGTKASVVAFHKMTGKLVWQSVPVGGSRAYVSPAIYQYEKFRFILALNTQYLMAIEPATGKVVWSYRYFDEKKIKDDDKDLICANTPIFKGKDIFLSIGYNYPNMMLTLNADGSGVTEKWSNLILDNHHHGVVEKDGFLYGSNWESNSKGKWVCLNWETGELKYETIWLTKGALIFADELFYVLEEKAGTVALIQPNPEKFEVISSFKLQGGNGPFWSHPFITNGKMYLRHGDALFVYKIKN